VSIPSRHPELDSGSIHRGKEGSPLTPTLSRRARGKRVAFTLAEVLITLAIIGVVAAMTIPTLIFNYNKKVIETRLARFYSIMNNAVALSEVDIGPKTSWNFVISKTDEEGNLVNQLTDTSNFVDKYLSPYLKVVKVENVAFSGMDVAMYYLSDGTSFCITHVDSHHIYFFPKKPSEKALANGDAGNGIDYFPFGFLPSVTPHQNSKFHLNKGVEPYKFGWDGNYETLLTGSKYSCDDTGMYCTALIQANGWKIPDNYPRSLK